MKTCFIIMPFSKVSTDNYNLSREDLDFIYQDLIKKAVDEYVVNGEKYFTEVIRYEEQIGSIIQGIVKNLKDADLVIADLTGLNPNVMYELGVRHSLKRGTIMISQDLNNIPSDLRDYFSVAYLFVSDNVLKQKEAYNLFKNDLHTSIRQLFESKKADSPVLDFIGTKELYKKQDEILEIKEATITLKAIALEINNINSIISETIKNNYNIVDEQLFLELIKFYFNNLHSKLNLLKIPINLTYLFEDLEAFKVLLIDLIQKFSLSDHYANFKSMADSPFENFTIKHLLEREVLDPIYLRVNRNIRKIKIIHLFDKEEILYKHIFENIAAYIEDESARLNAEEEVHNLLTEINEMDMKTIHKTK